MKILNHALVGVRKGRASESGMAIEVSPGLNIFGCKGGGGLFQTVNFF